MHDQNPRGWDKRVQGHISLPEFPGAQHRIRARLRLSLIEATRFLPR